MVEKPNKYRTFVKKVRTGSVGVRGSNPLRSMSRKPLYLLGFRFFFILGELLKIGQLLKKIT